MPHRTLNLQNRKHLVRCDLNIKQECIPVGCVPAARWPYSGGGYLVPGGYMVPGVYLVQGGCTWSQGECTWARGVYLVQGVYLVPGGAPGLGGVSVRYTPQDQTRYTPPGDQTRYTPLGPDQVHPPGTRPGTPHPGPDQVHPPVNRITDRCKNITLAQLHCGR